MFRTLLLTEDGSYGDGSWSAMAALPESYGADGWGAVLDRAAPRVRDDGVILMTGAMADRLGYGPCPSGMTEPERAAHPAAESARAYGWKAKYVKAWTTYQRPLDGPGQSYALHVGVLDWMAPEDLPAVRETPQEAAALLHAWSDEFGVPWAGNSAVAGVTLVRQLGRGPYDKRRGYSRPRWKLPADVANPKWSHAASFHGLNWRAPASEQPAPYQHTYDVNKQWLNAAGMTLLAADSLTHTGRIAYDAKRAGMWLVRFEPWTRDHLLPNPAGHVAAQHPGEPVWVSTPRLGLVDQLVTRDDEWQHPGYTVEDSWTAPGSLVLKPWAAGLRGVLDDPELGPACKDVYARTFTTISRAGRRVYRPDWACAVVDMGQVNLWRKLLQVQLEGGPAPVRIGADQPTWASAAADWRDDVPTGLGQFLSEQPGKLKYKATKALEAAV